MGMIQKLSNQLANMIAAGEVIERPSSVVKELLENAIDAQATRIEIHIEQAGRTRIEVSDNGRGMDQDDLRLSIERHATSKLITEENLFRIQTLGFRGEALPSIMSVSYLTIQTSSGQRGGHQLTSEDQTISIQPFARSQGTTVIVKDLFYNTPARLKYLKNDAIETSAILDVITRVAFAHPELALVVHLDGKRAFFTDGRNQLLSTITSCLGHPLATHMVPFSFQDPDVTIQGYLGKPDVAKSHRYGIYLSVNGRSVYMPKIQQAIIEAYKPYLPPVRFPVVILQLTIDPGLLDVNVHPAKRDIRYSKEDALKKALLETIPNTLRQQNLATVPVSVFSGEKSELSVEKKGLYEQEEEIEQLRLEFQDSTERSIHLEILGVLDATYILCKDNHAGYYVIDQHAAHERVHYEEQLAKIKTSSYAVAPLVPLLVDLTPADKPRMNEALFSLLATVGVQLEWFGDLTLKVVTLPTWALSIGQTYVEDLLQQCFHEPSLNEDKLRLYSIASKACRMSIKAHDYVDTQSLTILLERLLQCQFPYACPHGRPTMIHYSLAQLERLFNRTGF